MTYFVLMFFGGFMLSCGLDFSRNERRWVNLAGKALAFGGVWFIAVAVAGQVA